jgi:hypothetical protein
MSKLRREGGPDPNVIRVSDSCSCGHELVSWMRMFKPKNH